MSEFAWGAVGVLIAIAIGVFAIFGGLALVMHNGQAQACATSGGHWHATDNPVTHGGGGGTDRVRECTR